MSSSRMRMAISDNTTVLLPLLSINMFQQYTLKLGSTFLTVHSLKFKFAIDIYLLGFWGFGVLGFWGLGFRV